MLTTFSLLSFLRVSIIASGIWLATSMRPACSSAAWVAGSAMKRYCTWSSLGAPPQYDGLRSSDRLIFGLYSTNLKGPVPTGFMPKNWLPFSLMYFGGTIMAP